MGDQQASTGPAGGLVVLQQGHQEATRQTKVITFDDHVRAVQAGPGGSDFDVAFQGIGGDDSVEESEARVAGYLAERAPTGGRLVAQTEVFTALLTGLRETQSALANGLRTLEDRRNVRIWQKHVLPLFRSPRAEGLIGRLCSRLAEVGHLRVETNRYLEEWHRRRHLRTLVVYSLGAFALGSAAAWAIWWSV